MKKLLGFAISAFVCAPAFAAQGTSGTLTVSSGTFKAIQGFTNSPGNFVQGIAVTDSSNTVAAPVDAVTGIAVSISTSALTTATAVKVDGSAVTQPVSGTVISNAGTGTLNTYTTNTTTVSQSGTWTVQPGNTANTTAWKVDGSAVTQPVSGTVTANEGGTWTVQPGNTANTTAWVVQTSSFGVNGSTMACSQQGAWTVQPGNTANTTAWKVDGSAVTQPVSGTFWQTTQPVSFGPTNGATVTPGTGTFPVSGTFWQATQPVSGTFWQTTQPVSFGPTNGATVTPGTGTFPVSGTFWQTTQPVSFGPTNGTTVTPGTGTFPVSGTFWQSTQPVSFGPTNGVTVTPGTGTFTNQGALSDNGAAATTNRIGSLPGIYQNTPLNGTAGTQGRNAALSVGTDGNTWMAVQPALRPASYSASTNTIASAASATDISAICGNATNTVLVTGLRVSCNQTTAGTVPLTIVRRSTAYTGAWSTMTVASDDPTDYAVASSSGIFFTANPTLGTLVGHVSNYKLGCNATATATPNDIYIDPRWYIKPQVLKGTGQCLGVNLEATTVSGGSFTVDWKWEEITTISP